MLSALLTGVNRALPFTKSEIERERRDKQRGRERRDKQRDREGEREETNRETEREREKRQTERRTGRERRDKQRNGEREREETNRETERERERERELLLFYLLADIPSFEDHMTSMFKLVHVAPLSTSIQSLTLLYQIMERHQSVSARYYRALYQKILNSELSSRTGQQVDIVIGLVVDLAYCRRCF